MDMNKVVYPVVYTSYASMSDRSSYLCSYVLSINNGK